MSESRLCGLPRAAALALHAQSLYITFCVFYRPGAPPWEQLTYRDRYLWITKAGDAMDRLHPDPTPSLFERVADIARWEAKRVLAFKGQDDSQGRD